MEHANDNDTLARKEALYDLMGSQGEALLGGLYAQKLLVARHQVETACAALDKDFLTLDAFYFSEPEENQRAWLLKQFGSAELADAFEAVSEFHSHTVHFWHALAAETSDGSSPARDDETDTCRGA